MYNAGQSALAGVAQSDYLSRAKAGDGAANFFGMITSVLDLEVAPSLDCPDGDPLTAEAIVKRAATQSCAGCHAPENFIGQERSLGCGLSFPSALAGGMHIDEKGTISPALADVFLPRRAEVMSTYLQNCDLKAIYDNLLPVNSVIPK
jgi:mono/diheme cytochrome c family protein